MPETASLRRACRSATRSRIIATGSMRIIARTATSSVFSRNERFTDLPFRHSSTWRSLTPQSGPPRANQGNPGANRSIIEANSNSRAGSGPDLRLGPGDEPDFDAAIALQAADQLPVAVVLRAHVLACLAGHGFRLPFCIDANASGIHALAGEVDAHGFGAPPGERQVVRAAADPVGVTDGVDSIVGPILQLGGEIVELRCFTGTHFGPVVAEVRRCAQRLTRHGLDRSGRLRLVCRVPTSLLAGASGSLRRNKSRRSIAITITATTAIVQRVLGFMRSSYTSAFKIIICLKFCAAFLSSARSR